MESNWRFMVEDIGMGGWLHYAPDPPRQCDLAAELIPPLPHPFAPLTHMASLRLTGGGRGVYYGRLLAGSLVVVTTDIFPPGVPFPFGYGVSPDGSGVIP